MPLTEEEALASAANCLNCGICSECHQCKIVCPADAIDFDMRAEEKEVEVGSVVVSTGFRLFPGELMERFGFGKYRNVITAMQMDRLVAPTRPFNYVLQPRRRQDAGQHRLCLLRRLARPHGEQSHLLARLLHVLDQAGAAPARGAARRRRHDVLHRHPRLRQGLRRVLRADEGDGRALREGQGREDHGEGGRQPRAALRGHRRRRRGPRGRARPGRPLRRHRARIPNSCVFSTARRSTRTTCSSCASPRSTSNPAKTSIDGVFAAGAATGPMDIPDTILHSGAAAAQAASYIESLKRKR